MKVILLFIVYKGKFKNLLLKKTSEKNNPKIKLDINSI